MRGGRLRGTVCGRLPRTCLIGTRSARALEGIRPTHVFLTSWMRQATEAENIRVNSAMVRNVLEALSPSGSVRHVALVTGLKHYLGPFESYGKGSLPADAVSRRAGQTGRRELLLRAGG